MSSLLKASKDCRQFQNWLEEAGLPAAALAKPRDSAVHSSLAWQTLRAIAPGTFREHLEACAECQCAANDYSASRELLAALPSASEVARPWFAPRVMAAIAARESELRSANIWSFVPKFAARLTWASAIALLLASTWLYERPAPPPAKAAAAPTDLTGEPVVENFLPVSNDDVLASLSERTR